MFTSALHRLSADERCLALFIVVVSMRRPLDVTGSFLDHSLTSYVIVCEGTVFPIFDPLLYNLDRVYKLIYKLSSTIHFKQTLASKRVFTNASSGHTVNSTVYTLVIYCYLFAIHCYVVVNSNLHYILISEINKRYIHKHNRQFSSLLSAHSTCIHTAQFSLVHSD